MMVMSSPPSISSVVGAADLPNSADSSPSILTSASPPPATDVSSCGSLGGYQSPPPPLPPLTYMNNNNKPPAAAATSTVCALCGENYQLPKVLACFHTFCKSCLEKLVDSPKRIICPTCQAETQLCADQGVDSLLSDYAAANLIDEQHRHLQQQTTTTTPAPIDDTGSGGGGGEDETANGAAVDSQATASCTGCKSKDSSAVAHCYDCTNYLCANCVMAHQFMHCFEGHRVVQLSEMDAKSLNVRPTICLQHKQEHLKFFCFTCNIPICKECTLVDHPRSVHQFESIADIATSQLDYMQRLLEEARNKQKSLMNVFKGVDAAGHRLGACVEKSQMCVAETAHVLQQLIDEQRQQALKDLDAAYSSKQSALNAVDRKLQQTMEKLSHTIEFTSRLMQFAAPTEVLVFKKLLENRLQAILNYNPDLSLISHYELEFVPNIQAARLAISNTFGYVRQNHDIQLIGKNQVQPISRPTLSGSLPSSGMSPPNATSGGGGNHCALSPLSSSLPHQQTMIPSIVQTQFSPGLLMGGTGGGQGQGLTTTHATTHAFSDSNLLQSKQFGGSSQSLGPFSSLSDTYNYEKWSSGGSDFASSFYSSSETPIYFSSPTLPDQLVGGNGGGGGGGGQQIVDLTPKTGGGGGVGSSLFPPKSQIKRHKMIYHCKFGEFGVMEGQFTEPSGVAVNAQNDIIVADTNNHRIQIFDKEGRFKFQFGECGKRDGQLLYPNRVAVNRSTGDIVVTERSPTHQIQVYNQYGQFLRKFGANILQHPRGVTVDAKGRIVVVECKVMRVIIFDLNGNVLQKFGCSKYLEFPNGVVTNDKQEIFISDNRAHCVKVFNYDGVYLRQIGGEGLTNYPIGVGVNHLGEVVVADNHNNFNLTVFQQDATLVNALESKVKHAQCFDVALLDDGSVVLASKDYRLYIYRYLQVPPLPL